MSKYEKDFYAADPRGYKITLSSARYTTHIIGESGHTDVLPKDIMRSIEDPVRIYQSSGWPSRDVYFAKSSSKYPKLYVKTVAEIDEDERSGEVVTAFLQKKIGGGIDEEKGPKYVRNDDEL